jgi:hypothetical protein
MSNYKTSDYIIGVVRSLLGAITVPKYLTTKPTDAVTVEYVVINSLPINADVMQKCYVNVNYHVKDLGEGIKDSVKLEAGSVTVLSILKHYTDLAIPPKYMIDFENQETIREDALGEHFSNLRFSFKFINN